MVIDHTGYLTNKEEIKKTLQLMDEANIDKLVVMPGYAPFPKNMQLAEIIKGQDRILGSAWINPHMENAPEELRTLVQRWGFKDLKMMPTSHYFRAEGEIVHPLMREAGKLKIPVTVHSGTIFAYPFDIGALAEVFPDVPIIMEHMGLRHTEPAWGFAQAILVAKKFDNVYLDTTQNFRPDRIKTAVESVGADRVIFGTGIPHANPKQCIEVMKAAKLSEKDEELVLGGTLAKLYRISYGR